MWTLSPTRRMFLDGYGLTKDHPLRESWKQEYKRDPVNLAPWIFFFAMMTTVIAAAFAVGFWVILSSDTHNGPEDWALSYWVGGLFLAIGSLGATLASYATDKEFAELIERIPNLLNIPFHIFAGMNWEQLFATVENHLTSRAAERLKAEREHPDDPYAEQRVKTKSTYEEEFEVFKKGGLIRNPEKGFRPHFKQAAALLAQPQPSSAPPPAA